MTLPTPVPGLVIRYAYLWKREHEAGQEEGSKDRPCAIVMCITTKAAQQQVLVLPITHAVPHDPADAVEIPQDTKRRLGLDSDRSWVVISEANEFVWPGPDLRPVQGADISSLTYGVLPPRFFDHIRDQFLARDRREKSIRVKRTE